MTRIVPPDEIMRAAQAQIEALGRGRWRAIKDEARRRMAQPRSWRAIARDALRKANSDPKFALHNGNAMFKCEQLFRMAEHMKANNGPGLQLDAETASLLGLPLDE
ncbi:MAG TPA: hypothetical protein VKT73_15275 [Xanthobacteraceae bacterium]|nr:hypothetical protein [Xanthobacteraceae bacterium]